MTTAEKAESWAKRGKKVVLVRTETSPEDIQGMHVAAIGSVAAAVLGLAVVLAWLPRRAAEHPPVPAAVVEGTPQGLAELVEV